MCLIVFSFERHERYRVVLAANRDEFLDRPTAPAALWPGVPAMIAGRDLRAGGAWLGVAPGGRFAAVTNYRESAMEKSNAPSRGGLVPGFLIEARDPEAFLETVSASGERYNGFNLLTGDADGLWWYSNRFGKIRSVEPGLHGLSNHLLDTPWPKVRLGKARLDRLLAAGTIDPESIFDMLKDETRAPDESLPDTGVGQELERRLSPLFIHMPQYGTRCSSILLIDYDGRTRFLERTYPADGGEPFDVSFEI